MKEHKKLYKAGKNWLVATIAITSLGIIALQENVSADNTVGQQSVMATKNNEYGTQGLVSVNGEQNVPVDNNVTINAQASSKADDLHSEPGFGLEMQSKNAAVTLPNNSDVSVYRYSLPKYPGTGDAPHYDLNNTNVNTDPVCVYDDVKLNGNTITRTRDDDELGRVKIQHNIQVKGNSVINTVSVNGVKDMPNGAWGIQIQPNWDNDFKRIGNDTKPVNNDIKLPANSYDHMKPYFAYKLGDVFYYVILDTDNKPQWIEVIKPINRKMFVGAKSVGKLVNIDGTHKEDDDEFGIVPSLMTNPHVIDPVLGGKLVSDYINYYNNALYMTAPDGNNATFSYQESYYPISDAKLLINSLNTTAKPGQSNTSSTTTKPSQPNTSSTATKPGQSNTSSTTTKPSQPNTSSTATKPGQPNTSSTATKPGQSNTSSTTTKPGQPNTSSTATKPGQPNTSSTMTKPGQPNTSSTATKPGQPNTSSTTTKSDQLNTSNTTTKSSRSNNPSTLDNPSITSIPSDSDEMQVVPLDGNSKQLTVKASAPYTGKLTNNTTVMDSQLPQTGNKNTVAVIVLSAISTMFGIGLAITKKQF